MPGFQQQNISGAESHRYRRKGRYMVPRPNTIKPIYEPKHHGKNVLIGGFDISNGNCCRYLMKLFFRLHAGLIKRHTHQTYCHSTRQHPCDSLLYSMLSWAIACQDLKSDCWKHFFLSVPEEKQDCNNVKQGHYDQMYGAQVFILKLFIYIFY